MPAGPIVLFPGIMGSRLYFPAADRFWDPDSPRRMLLWAPVWPVRSDDDNRRDLHVNRPAGVVVDPLDDEFTPSEGERGWGGVVWSYYGQMLRDLQAATADGVYAIGYDWRQRIEWLGDVASARIQRVLDMTGAAKLSIVTHSMGGLVVRAAFRSVPALRDRVARVVHVCQPTAGAVILYRRLFTGMMRPYDGGGSISARAFRLVLGNSRTAFLGNMSGLPGAMQLLPSPQYPIVDGHAWNPLLPTPPLYTGAHQPPGIGDAGLMPEVAADLGARLGEVNAFHTWLGSPTDPAYAHPETWLVYGADLKTETSIGFDEDRVVPGLALAGDEVVPAASANALELPPGRAMAFTNLVHAQACNEEAVRGTVRDILLAP